ncbi:putative thiopurine S-methyltransferase (TPMT) [Lyophyllum shimeji]|uniref:Thiopurine S-methyltransferase (TPMT) n=1 Tax=Lyophyllum shimeji TaxID=47721 RepID=A0A9P3PPN5_LYOSH|nr:putative thiopurine S-methyltransferase (TPMT) [Lyophyllum shimeji]
MSSNDTAAVASLPDVAKVREIVESGDPATWDLAWQAGITPWDAGESQPPLREVVESGAIDFPRQGRALVPGCGSGYDVIYIASALRLDTIGMEVAPTAVAKARALLASNEIQTPGRASFELGDFFTLNPSSPEDRFDVIYDYTFFVAIPPARRPEWGRQMSSLVKPGGFLVTLVWPIDAPTEVGPPFFVRVEHYEDVLGDNFVKVFDKVPETSLPRHAGKERIVVWKRS